MRRALIAVAVVAAGGLPGTPGTPRTAAAAGPETLGAFGTAFAEPGAGCRDVGGRTVCEPGGASQVVLPDGRLLYWDALAGMEDVSASVVTDYGDVAQNDMSRVLDLAKLRWTTPTPADGGADEHGEHEYLPGPLHQDDRADNDGDLFCTSQLHLADGRVLVVGGTGYYQEPGVPGVQAGVAELEGLKSSRLFDPARNAWTQSGRMSYGRWYPTMVTLPSGKVLVASGVTKLIKPMYPDRPADSGTNVKQLEVYDSAAGAWTTAPASASRSLPLYPRLHLLPNGHVLYAAGGQAFNPSGQSYDEALWNQAASFDPGAQTWTDLGIPGLGTALPGFRGSSFSLLMPLEPDKQGRYVAASILQAGGVAGVTPGSYLGTTSSNLLTVDTTTGDALTTTATGPLTAPRWYGTGVLLPTGEVFMVGGADRDEVVGPGSGTPRPAAELYDPVTRTWRPAASSPRGRTYHNAAVLLPDGRVLVGGHSPIATAYGFQEPTLHEQAGFSSPYRDQTFEIYSPPYLFRGDRPVIRDVAAQVRYGHTLDIDVTDARDIDRVVLVRNPALTHLVDADQRQVVLPIVRSTGGTVTVQAPPDANVAPPGPYLLFVQRRTGKGPIPSVARQVYVGAKVPQALARMIESRHAADARRELAQRR